MDSVLGRAVSSAAEPGSGSDARLSSAAGGALAAVVRQDEQHRKSQNGSSRGKNEFALIMLQTEFQLLHVGG